MNIAFEISPFITASGTFGDKSGVYRYMYGLLSSLIKITQKNDKKMKIVLFSLNKDLLKLPLNPEILSFLEYQNVSLIKPAFEMTNQKDLEDSEIFDYPVIRFFTKYLDALLHIRSAYINFRHRTRFHKYIAFINREFKRRRVKIVFHSETGFFPFFQVKNIITIYDLTTMIIPHFHREETIDLQKRKLKFAKKFCQGIICISKSTQRDLLQYDSRFSRKKIIVGYPGLDANFQIASQKIDEESSFIDDFNILLKKNWQPISKKKYLLYYGTFEPRKNITYLVKAFVDLQKKNEIPQDFRLVLCGGEGWGNVRNMIVHYLGENFPFKKKNNIIVLDYLGDKYLTRLIRNAYAVVYPSIYEGFGLPVLESMALGIPVICGKNSSIPEVGGKAALYVDAVNYSDIKNKIEILVNNPKLARGLAIKGRKQSRKFRWEKTAADILDFLHSI